MHKLFYFSILLFLLGCAQVTSLNLKKHQFGQIPTKIIWIQVDGLQEEHLALLKFSKQSSEINTSFEDFLCIGKTWEYDLFNLRPTANSSFMAQITGKKNIKNTCEDYEQKPIWSYVLNKGYRVGVFEGEDAKDNSFLKSLSCKEKGQDFLKNITLWEMDPKTKEKNNLFHLNEKIEYNKDQVYYDKSCLTGECYSTFSQNISSVFKEFSRKSNNYIFMVRNFKFKNALDKQNYKAFKNELIELDKVVKYFQEESEKRNDMLVLLTTASAKGIEFPRSGKEWQEFETTGKYLVSKKTKLISTVFASGARAENFCGIYEQSKILSRIFSGAKQQGLELAIINPFE